VASHALELPCKSVEAYRESEKLGETLAMSNLSFKLSDAGFLEEASQLCNQAIKIENCDPQVGAAIARIKEVRQNEEEKEQKILEGTKLKRMFFVEYAHACTKNRLTSISGIWEGPECRLDVVVKDGKFEAPGSYEKQGFGIGLAAALSGIPGPYKESQKKIFEVIYSGEIIGHGIKYRHWVRGKDLMPTLLTDDNKEGLMYVSDNVTEIHVYEKGKRTEEKFYSLKQIT
jgi:hypothetical protein